MGLTCDICVRALPQGIGWKQIPIWWSKSCSGTDSSNLPEMKAFYLFRAVQLHQDPKALETHGSRALQGDDCDDHFWTWVLISAFFFLFLLHNTSTIPMYRPVTSPKKITSYDKKNDSNIMVPFM